MRRLRATLFVALIIMIALCWLNTSKSEEIDPEDYITLTVIGSDLNCRMAANKQSVIMTELEKGQEILSTGRWSKDYKWVEIDHPECGRLWCSYKYLAERTDSFEIETLCDEPIKIRKHPYNGRVTGYLRKGRTVTITQTLLGWGKCSVGWIDLSYCLEIED